MNYSGQIELTKLQSVIIEKQGKTGMVRGVFIPIELNHLDEFEAGRVAINIDIYVNDEKDKFGNDGSIKQKVSSKEYKSASEQQKEDFKKLPYLGNFKNFYGGNVSSTPVQTFSDDDDLPF